MNKDIAQRALETALACGASGCRVTLSESTQTSVSYLNGEIEKLQESTSAALGITLSPKAGTEPSPPTAWTGASCSPSSADASTHAGCSPRTTAAPFPTHRCTTAGAGRTWNSATRIFPIFPSRPRPISSRPLTPRWTRATPASSPPPATGTTASARTTSLTPRGWKPNHPVHSTP